MTSDGSDYFGASLGALRRLAGARGYRLVHTDIAGVNAFFVREDLAGSFASEDEVPVRAPNFFLQGAGHPPHAGTRVYVEPRSEPTRRRRSPRPRHVHRTGAGVALEDAELKAPVEPVVDDALIL